MTVDGTATEYSYNNSPITFKIKGGSEYIISFTSIDGYATPSSLTYTAIENTTRSETVVYEEAELGFFYFNTISYTFELGMTWQEFVDSDYNIDGVFTIKSGGGDLPSDYVAYSGYPIEPYNYSTDGSVGYAEVATDIIVDGQQYSTICCFVAGTQVAMADGTTKSIENVVVGDLILSYNINTKTTYKTIVIDTVIHPDSVYMARITTQSGIVLEMTSYHPLLTVVGWKSITNHNGYATLVEGDQLRTINGNDKIASIELYENEIPITTYTLCCKDVDETVDNDINDNFYANGIAAHNAAAPCVKTYL